MIETIFFSLIAIIFIAAIATLFKGKRQRDFYPKMKTDAKEILLRKAIEQNNSSKYPYSYKMKNQRQKRKQKHHTSTY